MAASPTFHVVMFPWLAMGHIIPYLKFSNKLAEYGHRVSFIIPSKTQNKVNHLNLHPHLIQFIPIIIPPVDGIPLGVETTADVPTDKTRFVLKALDLTKDQVEAALNTLKPAELIFFDHAYWIPPLAKLLGMKSIYLCTASVLSCVGLAPRLLKDPKEWTELDLLEAPQGFPGSSSSMPRAFEMKEVMFAFSEFDGQISLIHRVVTSLSRADALCFGSCRELEGAFVDYLEKQYNKQVLLIGPSISKPPETPIEERWDKWLGCYEKGSVVYCAFGSECVLDKEQFQELILGFEETGYPFLVRLKPPSGAETVEEALPEGFEERVKGRGVVHGGWVQQQHILSHPSVGCFVSHCGFGSMWESLVSSCQLVLVPNVGDQFLNTNFMTKGLKVAVDVERREEDGWFTRKDVCKAVKLVMDEGSETSKVLRDNHQKLKDLLLTRGLETSYFSNFINNLQDILK